MIEEFAKWQSPAIHCQTHAAHKAYWVHTFEVAMPLAFAIQQIMRTIRIRSATKACGDAYETTQILGPRLHNSYMRQKRHYHNKQ